MNENIFRAGAGKCVISFPDGYFPHEGYYGIHDEIYARALILDAGVRAVIVSLDLPSIRPAELLEDLRRQISEQTGTTYERAWLACVHDLSAPHVPKEADKRRMHMEAVAAAIRSAVQEAMDGLRPATADFGLGYSDIITNRDVESVDGWWVGIDGTGPSDKTLFAARFSDSRGEPIAIVYNYALKPCVMEGAKLRDGKKYVTGDLCGETCRLLEEKYRVPVLFFMSGGGDQVPAGKANYLAVDEEGKFRVIDLYEKGYEIISELGKQLAEDVAKTVSGLGQHNIPRTFSTHHLNIRVPGQRRFSPEKVKPPVRDYTYYPDEDQTVEVDAIRLGDAVLLGMKPEIMTETYAELKRCSPFKYTLLFTLVNGCQDYIPTDIDYERFEYPALHATVAKGSDRIFLNESVRWLEEIREG